MEKLVCALWKSPDESADAFAARLREQLPGALRDAGAVRIRLNLRDSDVAAANSLVQRWQEPQQDAVVQFWLASANPMLRAPVDAVLATHAPRHAAWLVSESTILANCDHPPQPGERTWGWSQASFISFRSDITRAEAIAHWHNHHTRVAIETQANFEYVQNLIVLPLTADAPSYDAFVEECFPATAMTDPAEFFDASGDPARFEENTRRMMESCTGFIDFGRIDIIPTSQFDFVSGDAA